MQFSGTVSDNNFPKDPILIEGDRFYLNFHSDFSAEEWGYAIKARIPGKVKLDTRLEVMRSVSTVTFNIAKYQPHLFFQSVAADNFHGLKVLIDVLERVDDCQVYENIYLALLSIVSRTDLLDELFRYLDQTHKKHHIGLCARSRHDCVPLFEQVQ